MSGHLFVDVDAWAETAEALTAAGVVYPLGTCAADLRWWVDREAGRLRKRGITTPTHEQLMAGLLGRPAYAKRWRRTDHFVRALIRDVECWWDAYRWGPIACGATQLTLPAAADRQPTANRRQPAASRPPADTRSDAETQTRSASPPPAHRQPTASGAPHARSSHPTPTPHTSDPPLPPASGGPPPDSRALWVRDRVAAALAADLAAGHDVGPYLAAYAVGAIAHVRSWLERCKPRKAGAQKLPPSLPDAPAGLRQRDVEAGLRLVAELWRAEGRPTHAPTPTPPELPAEDPPPEPEPEPVERPPPRATEEGQSERAKRRVEEARRRTERQQRRTA